MHNDSTDEAVPEPIDRPTGILTERQRKWLLGQLDDELSAEAERQMSWRVRRRVRHALIDFTLLQWLDTTHVNQIFDGVHEDVEEGAVGHDADDELTNSLPHVFEFLMRGFRLRQDLFEWAFEAGIQSAIIQGAVRTQDELPVMDVTFDFDIEGVVPLDELENRYEDEELLTKDALMALVISDTIEWEDARSYPSITDNTNALRSITIDIEDTVDEID